MRHDTAIYSDDPNAIQKLRDKIQNMELQRERIKIVNRLIRTCGGLQNVLSQLTDTEARHLTQLAVLTPYHKVETKGYPAYELQNLGGNITRTKQRLASLLTDIANAQPEPVRAATYPWHVLPTDPD